MTNQEAIVIGGGLAGLTAAWRLVQRGLDVVLFEASDRVGGCIHTAKVDGFLFERGPNSMRGQSLALGSLVTSLDLDNERILSNPVERHAWIWRQGKRHALPSSPPALLRTSLLSVPGKLRLLAEPLLPRYKARASGTSVAQFLGARLGAEAVTAMVDPFVSGVFAGDPAKVGVEAFEFLRVAAEKGGIVRALPALRANRPSGGGGPRSSTFRDGLETLPRALAKAIGENRIRTARPVSAVALGGDGLHTVTFGDGQALQTRRLVLATPPSVTARLLAAPDIAMPTAPVVTVSLGLRRHDLPVEPDGFGVLLASDSPLGVVIGVVFGSSIFPGRAPDDQTALTCILGGARYPEAVDLDDSAALAAATHAIETMFDARGPLQPIAHAITRWKDGIPQVTPGHLTRVAAFRDGLPRGVALAGALDGPGLDPVAASGLRAADHVSQ